MANLGNASFYHSNAKRALFNFATLTGVNFSLANLYEAEFVYTTITNEQLESALSIQDALLPDETRANGQNLISNDEASCNISRENGWKLQNGSVVAVQSNHDNSSCEFILQTISTGATMYQRINLSNKWDSTNWPYSRVVLRANLSVGISMELRGIRHNNQPLAWQPLCKCHHILSDDDTSSIYRFN